MYSTIEGNYSIEIPIVVLESLSYCPVLHHDRFIGNNVLILIQPALMETLVRFL